jgi:hypothetical protein
MHFVGVVPIRCCIGKQAFALSVTKKIDGVELSRAVVSIAIITVSCFLLVLVLRWLSFGASRVRVPCTYRQ